MNISTSGEPLSIASIGSFYAGGKRLEVSGKPQRHLRLTADLPHYPYDPNGIYAIDHAYVNYVVPAKVEGLPVVFLHGGGLTGSMWETTPDGRPGWLTSFLRAGHPCYIVDNAERGRAGWCSIEGEWEGEPVLRTEAEAWTTYRIGPAEGYPSRTPYPGSLFPVFALAEASMQAVPRWVTNNFRQIKALEAVVERIGRCVVVSHSHGGGIASHVAKSLPDLIAASVLLEPNGLPEVERDVTPGPQVIVSGDYIDDSALFSELAERWAKYLTRADECDWPVELLRLTEAGFKGNSHNMMMDSNSDEIAALVQRWIREHTPTNVAPI